MDASWASQYSSLSELARDADAIVVGHVKGVARRTTTGEALSFTDFDYVVEEWVSAPAGAAMLPGAILIHQTGGIINGRNVEVSGDPLLVPGERSVLFLREYAPGRYFILGGPVGRLLRDGPQVARLPDVGSLAGLPPSLAETLSVVTDELRSGSSRSVPVIDQ